MGQVLAMDFSKVIPAWFFQLCENTPPGSWAKHSGLIFPIIETFHLLALAMLLGSLLIVDLRLLGYGMRRQSAAQLSKYFEPWTMGGLALTVTTGIPMFMMGAIGLSHITWFFYKMVILLVAVTLHFAFHRKAVASGASPELGKRVAYLSLTLWWCVAIAGRAIGFFV